MQMNGISARLWRIHEFQKFVLLLQKMKKSEPAFLSEAGSKNSINYAVSSFAEIRRIFLASAALILLSRVMSNTSKGTL